MHCIGVVIGLSVSLASVVASEDTYRFGTFGGRLTATDLDAVSRAAAAGNARRLGGVRFVLPSTTGNLVRGCVPATHTVYRQRPNRRRASS